jgi:hypothetical protein
MGALNTSFIRPGIRPNVPYSPMMPQSLYQPQPSIIGSRFNRYPNPIISAQQNIRRGYNPIYPNQMVLLHRF